MKQYLLITFAILFCLLSVQKALSQSTSHSGYVEYHDTIPAPPCQYVEIVGQDTAKYRILSNFVSDLQRDNYFQNDKGIIRMTRYQDEAGDSIWILSPLIDNRYRDDPPTKFSVFNGRIILVYEGNQAGNSPNNAHPEAYNDCLEDIIGDRVYIRPSREDRWTKEYEFAGRLYNQGTRTVSTGGGGGITVRFKKDGNYKVNPMY